MNFTVPDFVDYPEFYKVLDEGSLFNGVFCYVIEPYNFDGVSLYIGFREQHSVCRLADFKSNNIPYDDIGDDAVQVMAWSQLIKKIMLSARIPDGLFYFSKTGDEIFLVDVMISANKFIGPGMLQDLFGNSGIKTQKVVCTDVIGDETVDNNNPKYKGKIIKPSRFRYLTEGGLIRPQYGII